MPQPFGGTYRQIQVYVDPQKLEAHQLSLTDVVQAINESNLILPAGDVRIGNRDYNIYANSQVDKPTDLNTVPLKSVGLGSVVVADVGKAEDAGAIQTNIVRIDGQRSVYIPILKQGGGSNTIEIVNGVKRIIKHLVDVPDSLRTAVVFDQSIFVKVALEEPVEGRGNRAGIDGLDDPVVPRKSESDICGIAFNSAVSAHLFSGDERHGRLHQYHVARRTGFGVFAIDRRFRCGAGEHFPVYGEWRAAAGSSRKRRNGSGAGGAGGDINHVNRVFPGDVFLRCQQISVYRPGAGRSAFDFCVVHFCHDGGAAVLRKVHSHRAARAWKGSRRT